MNKAKYASLSEYEAKYKKYFDVFESKSVKAKAGMAINKDDLVGLGEQLSKFENWKEFKEANGSTDDLGVVPKIGLDVIAAASSVSAIPLLAAVQPIEERKGLIYYKNVTARTTRGNVTAGDTLVSGEFGRQKTAAAFGGEEVTGEVLATGDGSATTFNVVVAYAPVRARTVEVTVVGQPDTLLIDDGKGRVVGVGGQGVINYESGTASITFTDAPADGAAINGKYSTNFETIEEIPSIDSDYETKEINAKFFALRSEIGLFKSYELSRRFNINAEEMLAQDLVNELTSEISRSLVIEAGANVDGTVTWSKTSPQGVGYMEHLLSLSAKLAEAENAILDQSGRLGTNLVYLVGTQAAAIFKTLPGFRVVGDIKATLGTHLFGTIEGRPVVRSIDVPANEVILVSKGDDMFNAALFYAPYMPLFVTSAMEGQDHNPLKTQKAAAAMAGIKAVAPALMAKIVITDA